MIAGWIELAVRNRMAVLLLAVLVCAAGV